MKSIFSEILGRENNLEKSFILGNKPASYSDLLSKVSIIESELMNLGCNEYERVGICLNQGLSYVASLLGVRKRGGIGVLMSLDWTDYEINRIITHSETRFIISCEETLGGKNPIRSKIIEGLNCIILEYDVLQQTNSKKGDTIIIYSSGTTGTPKGVVLSEKGISNNVRSVTEYLELCSDDSSPVFTPTCYSFSLSQVFTHLWAGAAILPVTTKLIFPMEILVGISKYRLTGVTGTASAFRVLTELENTSKLQFDSVRYAMIGGTYYGPRLTKLVESKFSNASIINIYGCSENSPRISYYYIEGNEGLSKGNYYSVGRNVQGTKIEVLKENGKIAGINEIGEITIGGNSLMHGYWKDEKKTNKRLRKERFYTGDLGFKDSNGLLYLTGRNDSIINVGNEKVSPEEVEQIINELAGVEESMVYGVSDPVLGNKVNADIVLDSKYSLKTNKIKTYCRGKLSSYKVPDQIFIVESVQKTLYGKIDRKTK
jgi:acyl-CoA synthetase (AMP-forming)/AMP-acid ligase II